MVGAIGGGGSHAVTRAVPRQHMHGVGVGVEQRQPHPQARVDGPGGGGVLRAQRGDAEGGQGGELRVREEQPARGEDGGDEGGWLGLEMDLSSAANEEWSCQCVASIAPTLTLTLTLTLTVTVTLTLG